MTRVAALVVAALLVVTGMYAQPAAAAEGPRWALELKGGSLRSAMGDWGDYYGDDHLTHFALGASYRPWRLLEFDVGIGYRSDDGQGFAPGHGTLAGDVTYRLFPLHVGVVLQLAFDDDQWLVPYAGIAAGRAHYRVRVSDQDSVSGGVTSTQFRVGVRLLLDGLDPRSAAELSRHFGIAGTWLFIEASREEAEVNGSDLGGRGWSAGLRVEF